MILTKLHYACEGIFEHNCTLLPWRMLPIDDEYGCINCDGDYQTRLKLCHDCYIGYSEEQSEFNINMNVIYKKQHIAIQCYNYNYTRCCVSIPHTDLMKRDIVFEVKFIKWWELVEFGALFRKVMIYNFWLISDLIPMDLKITIMRLMFVIHEKKRSDWRS
jgi:hypothetical protein